MSIIEINSIPKYAQSFTEFKTGVIHYSNLTELKITRLGKIAAANKLCNYFCDNAQYVFQHAKLAKTVEETLIRFWKKDLWLGARVYLQRLFPMSATLSGQRIVPRALYFPTIFSSPENEMR
jgi:hypothetical protein